MKAKLYTGILSVLLLTGSMVKAQIADMQDFRNDDARIVINNYYDDYDYYFSSRINRFHRSYAAFNYYAPVFTDVYWYNYQPYSWGVSIYGGGGFGYDNGWYDPYYGSSYYRGYDPFYYNNWYTPMIFNIRIRNGWHNNYYGWNGHNHGYNNHRQGYNTNNNFNNYSSARYSSSGSPSRRRPDNVSGSSSENGSRREVSTGNSSRMAPDRNNSAVKSNNAPDQSRRNTTPTVNRGQGRSASQGRTSTSKGESRSTTSKSSSSNEKSSRRK